jgi:hypothetical protein
MALSTYAELTTAIQDWMVRTDLSGNVADWITLAEARLNRELNPVETDNTLTGVADSREISTSALSVVEPIALYLIDTATSDETEITKKDDFARDATSGEPRYWRFVQHASTPKIIFDCPLDAAYTFRFVARVRFALSDSATTNWLLTNHSDLYLATSIFWGGMFTDEDAKAVKYKLVIDDALPSVRNIIAQSKRAVATVDPALRPRPMAGTYNGSTDS